ncbi:MAG: hypothetical protein IH934_06200 [Nanoarchaeota archaeon]|nr:hypothetical protein [Nanoarchaeota archaeon]
MKKAQTEIMGLAIIVILIMIGMFFVISFLTVDTIDYKKQFTQAELASNMLNTFLRTTSDCNGFSMTELLQDCNQDKSIICYGESSCDYVSSTAQQIFMETLEKWNVDYEFKVFNDENTLFTLGKTCINNKKSKLFPIPTDSGILFVKLDVC